MQTKCTNRKGIFQYLPPWEKHSSSPLAIRSSWSQQWKLPSHQPGLRWRLRNWHPWIWKCSHSIAIEKTKSFSLYSTGIHTRYSKTLQSLKSFAQFVAFISSLTINSASTFHPERRWKFQQDVHDSLRKKVFKLLGVTLRAVKGVQLFHGSTQGVFNVCFASRRASLQQIPAWPIQASVPPCMELLGFPTATWLD